MGCLSSFGIHFGENNFEKLNEKKDGLDVYSASNNPLHEPSRSKWLCPICWTELTAEQRNDLMNHIRPQWFLSHPSSQFTIYQDRVRSREVDIFSVLSGCAIFYENSVKYLETCCDEIHFIWKTRLT